MPRASAESRPSGFDPRQPQQVPVPARCACLLGIRSSGEVGAKTWAGFVATVFPECNDRDGQERADGGRRGGERRVGAARSAARTPDLSGLPWRPAI